VVLSAAHSNAVILTKDANCETDLHGEGKSGMMIEGGRKKVNNGKVLMMIACLC
jgi:hypothetical protein